MSAHDLGPARIGPPTADEETREMIEEMRREDAERKTAGDPERRDEPPCVIGVLGFELRVIDRDGRNVQQMRCLPAGEWSDVIGITEANLKASISAAALVERDRELSTAIEAMRRAVDGVWSSCGSRGGCNSGLPLPMDKKCDHCRLSALVAAYDARRAPAPAAATKEAP